MMTGKYDSGVFSPDADRSALWCFSTFDRTPIDVGIDY
jgi:hypothetical protein